MTDTGMATLRKLGDTGLTVADPNEDVRGMKVIDRSGEELGEVDDLMIDDREHKVRFLRVASGGFLGIGESHFMLPVEAITRISEDEVQVNQTRERIAGSPRYDPDLTNELDSLKDDRETIANELDQVRNATDDNWREAKEDVDQALGDLDERIDSLVSDIADRIQDGELEGGNPSEPDTTE